MIVDRADALKKLTHHQFVAGTGYVHHGREPELPAGCCGSKNCSPPDGTVDGSAHMLQPPGEHPPMKMLWVAAEAAWSHPALKGNRMAWTCDHLSRAGWAYVGPEEPKSRRRR